MSCPIKNPANYDLGDLEGHVTGMYDHFASKYGFQEPPTVFFDSDPSNEASVLGKTAYYDPQTLEVHVFTDARHQPVCRGSQTHYGDCQYQDNCRRRRIRVGRYHCGKGTAPQPCFGHCNINPPSVR